MAKRYKIEYRDIVRSKPFCLIQLCKSVKYEGVRIGFREDGKKHWQSKYKHGSLNGIYKFWWSDSKNRYFQNWKKDNEQGIIIKFQQ